MFNEDQLTRFLSFEFPESLRVKNKKGTTFDLSEQGFYSELEKIHKTTKKIITDYESKLKENRHRSNIINNIIARFARRYDKLQQIAIEDETTASNLRDSVATDMQNFADVIYANSDPGFAIFNLHDRIRIEQMQKNENIEEQINKSKQLDEIFAKEKEKLAAIEAKQSDLDDQGRAVGLSILEDHIYSQVTFYEGKVKAVESTLNSTISVLICILLLSLIRSFGMILPDHPLRQSILTADISSTNGLIYRGIISVTILSVLLYLIKIQYDQKFTFTNIITNLKHKISSIKTYRHMFRSNDDSFSEKMNHLVTEKVLDGVFRLGDGSLLGKIENNALMDKIMEKAFDKSLDKLSN